MKTNSRSRLFAAIAFTFSLLGAACVHAQPVVEAVMHYFTTGPDAEFPVTTPVLGQTDGALYGITFLGGTNGAGTIWKLNRDGSGYRLLHSFTTSDYNNGSALNAHPCIIQGADNVIYGTTSGNLGGSDITTNGTVFKMNPDGNFFTVLHTFTNADRAPLSLVQGRDGALYGAGAAIFKINTDGNGYTVLHTFSSVADGLNPFGTLIQGADDAFYGTTATSGPNGHGTVFKCDTNGTFTVLHSFGSIANDGQQALCGLVQADNGALYGMTRAGGSNTFGTVFMLNTNGSGYTNLHHFAGSPNDGSRPTFGALTKGLGGVLFGTTSVGGTSGQGAIFKIGLDGGGHNVLYSFSGPVDCGTPYGGLVAGPATDNIGVFYGSPSSGGPNVTGGVISLLVNPPVSITPVSNPSGTNGPVVFWPQWAFNYTLQMTTNPALTNWVTVSNAVPVVGVQVTNAPPAAYFRLIYQ